MKHIFYFLMAALIWVRCDDLPLEDFRECPWGCAIEHVQKKETADIIRGNTENLLFYYTELYGRPVYMAYIFNRGRLYKGKYYFINKIDYQGYLKDYEKLRACLIKQYGNPYEVEESYTGAFYTTWGVPRTLITLGLLGDSNSINLSLEYMKKEDTVDTNVLGIGWTDP